MNEDEIKLDEEVQAAISIIAEQISHGGNAISFANFIDETDDSGDINDLYAYFLNNPEAAINLIGNLEEYFTHPEPDLKELKKGQGEFPDNTEPWWDIARADATKVHPENHTDDNEKNAVDLQEDSVDLIITSPPYWKKRDYKDDDQLGQEDTREEYVENLINALEHWKVFLRSTGSVFLNIGDTYHNKSLQGIPGRFEAAAIDAGWTVRNEIRWAKDNGIPSSAQDRLVPRHEVIYHLVLDKDNYLYDLHGYSGLYGNGSNPGDVWRISHDRNTGDHLAPYPRDLAQRAATLACPPSICTKCGEPRRRQMKRGLTNLNTERQQARRALEIYDEHDELTEDHIRAIQAVGISDAGKAEKFQIGAGENGEDVQRRAKEAKKILGGYFREFTFPKWTTIGWSSCDCDEPELERGTIFDPFAGSGTTIQVANSLGYNGFGTDLDITNFQQDQTLSTYE